MTTEILIADETSIQLAARIIRRGGLVAFPTETVYGLGANAFDPVAVSKIYEAKGRPKDNPSIVHISRKDEVHIVAEDISPLALRLMDVFWPGPLTLILSKKDIIPHEVTGGLETVAVRMPRHPAAMALIKAAGVPIAAPSANSSGKPSPTSARHVYDDLNGKIELILDGGGCEIGLDSTVLDVTGAAPVILRPGFVTADDLASYAVIAANPATDVDTDFRPKSPGMKYRHYAPAAKMTVVTGENAATVLAGLAGESASAGKKTGLLVSRQTAEKIGDITGITVLIAGDLDRPETIASSLYRLLREFDETGVTDVFAEGYTGGGLLASVMNRLVKAAGGNIHGC